MKKSQIIGGKLEFFISECGNEMFYNEDKKDKIFYRALGVCVLFFKFK